MASSVYATVSDVASLWRDLSDGEKERVSALIGIVSAELRNRARLCGRDLDDMMDGDDDMKSVAKSVVVDVVKRYMNDNTSDGPAMSQVSQSAGGYSVSGTFLTPGGGLFIKKSELARLGLRRQRIGVIDLCGD